MKQVLIETQLFQPTPVSLTEGKVSKRGNPLVKGILATAEVKNGNGRYYSKGFCFPTIKSRFIYGSLKRRQRTNQKPIL